MRPSPKSIKPSPYPYKIPSVPNPNAEILTKVDPWDVLEFFRVEGLLRSEKVIDLYKNTFSKLDLSEFMADRFRIDYAVHWGWYALEGAHHCLLGLPQQGLIEKSFDVKLGSGIIDMGKLLKETYKEDPEWAMQKALSIMQGDDNRCLFITIDPTYPPSTILKALGLVLKKRHKEVKPIEITKPQVRFSEYGMELYRPTHSTKIPPLRNIQSWLNYFRCYDLRHVEAKTFGQIAMNVYGDSKKYEVAEHAYKRVSKLIEYAESNNWPPPSNFLNRK